MAGWTRLKFWNGCKANRPPNMHLIITGRSAPAELIREADLVTEMLMIKHPYEQGLKAQAGIEF